MNEKARKYIDLFRKVKIATAATVDEEGRPQTRIINVMLAEDDGMYIVTSKGKPFYKQLVETGEIALAAMCPDCQSLKFNGKLKIVDKKWIDKVFEQNPGMNEVYPGESRYILDAFHIYEGHGAGRLVRGASAGTYCAGTDGYCVVRDHWTADRCSDLGTSADRTADHGNL